MNVYTKLLKEFETGFLGFAPIAMMVQTCLGSIAVMYLLKDNSSTTIIELALCIITAMAFNAAVIGQLNKKWTFNLLLLSALVNTLIFVINV